MSDEVTVAESYLPLAQRVIRENPGIKSDAKWFRSFIVSSHLQTTAHRKRRQLEFYSILQLIDVCFTFHLNPTCDGQHGTEC